MSRYYLHHWRTAHVQLRDEFQWKPEEQASYDRCCAIYARCKWKPPKRYLVFDHLPLEAKSFERYWAYGWVLPHPMTWLQDFAGKTCGDAYANPVQGMIALKYLSGYRHLHLFPTPYDDENEPRAIYPSREYGDQEFECKWMIAICFTRSSYLFLQRPTGKAFDWLDSVLPGEPRWCPDYYPKDDWERHGIDWFPE